jgi:hypothetical protein
LYLYHIKFKAVKFQSAWAENCEVWMFLLWSTLVRWMLSERYIYCCELQRDMPFACHLICVRHGHRRPNQLCSSLDRRHCSNQLCSSLDRRRRPSSKLYLGRLRCAGLYARLLLPSAANVLLSATSSSRILSQIVRRHRRPWPAQPPLAPQWRRPAAWDFDPSPPPRVSRL